MRFPAAALGFLVVSFIFLAAFGVNSLILSSMNDAFYPIDDSMPSDYTDIVDLLNTALPVLSALFFIIGILLVFALESLSDEPEDYYQYYRRR